MSCKRISQITDYINATQQELHENNDHQYDHLFIALLDMLKSIEAINESEIGVFLNFIEKITVSPNKTLAELVDHPTLDTISHENKMNLIDFPVDLDISGITPLETSIFTAIYNNPYRYSIGLFSASTKVPKVPFNAQAFLAKVHKDMIELLPQKTSVHQVEFPLNDSGEILNPSIATWQENEIDYQGAITDENKLEGIKDFNRGAQLQGQRLNALDSAAIIQNLYDFCQKLPQNQRQPILTYLKSKPAQEIVSFVMEQLFSGFNAKMNEIEMPAIYDSTRWSLNWEIVDEQLIANIETNVYALTDTNDGFRLDTNTGKLAVMSNDERTNGKFTHPILRGQATVRLDVNQEHLVVPKVIDQTLYSYSTDVTPKLEVLQDDVNSKLTATHRPDIYNNDKLVASL